MEFLSLNDVDFNNPPNTDKKLSYMYRVLVTELGFTKEIGNNIKQTALEHVDPLWWLHVIDKYSNLKDVMSRIFTNRNATIDMVKEQITEGSEYRTGDVIETLEEYLMADGIHSVKLAMWQSVLNSILQDPSRIPDGQLGRKLLLLVAGSQCGTRLSLNVNNVAITNIMNMLQVDPRSDKKTFCRVPLALAQLMAASPQINACNNALVSWGPLDEVMKPLERAKYNELVDPIRAYITMTTNQGILPESFRSPDMTIDEKLEALDEFVVQINELAGQCVSRVKDLRKANLARRNDLSSTDAQSLSFTEKIRHWTGWL
jgi:hypothetical protein